VNNGLESLDVWEFYQIVRALHFFQENQNQILLFQSKVIQTLRNNKSKQNEPIEMLSSAFIEYIINDEVHLLNSILICQENGFRIWLS
jgi:hypothetical protein